MTASDDTSPRSADIVIAGGGIIGSCTAFFLRELGFTGSVLVLERDLSLRTASTTLSAASIRQQFSTALNARMSQFGFSFLRSLPQRFGPENGVALTERGYLILASHAGEAAARDRQAGVAAAGAIVAWLDPAMLSARFPWLSTEGLSGATLGLAGEGWFDAHLMLSAVQRAAKAAGVAFREAEVAGVEADGSTIGAVRTTAGDRIACGTLICAAGARPAHWPGSGAPPSPWSRASAPCS